ncbi:unnamed protein product [Brachionus calyciflorus]|uniref:Uncharacterized protein n=1 Tax=Brachionus calyciflorus TaxID=104777 RepID=A0A814F7J7_9BILA|nr:unnamed protein product [Brachionus calyciflorus]
MIALEEKSIEIEPNDSVTILKEVFDDFEKNLFEDYKKKLEKVVDIYNSDLFLNRAKQKVVEIIEKVKNDIPKIFSELKNETLSNIEVSVYQGFCSLKRKLDKLSEYDLFSNFDAFETLSSIASNGYTRLFDDSLSDKDKCDELYSIIFEEDQRNPLEIQEYAYRRTDQGWNTSLEEKQHDLTHNRKSQTDIFKNKVFDKIVSQLQLEFKPLEKKLTEAKETKKKALDTGIGLSVAAAALVPLTGGTSAAAALIPIIFSATGASTALAVGAGIEWKLGNRTKKDWYQNVESAIINYLKSKNTEGDQEALKKLINDESLEEDKHHIKEQFEIFFKKYDYNKFFDLNTKLELKKLHKRGTLLMFDSSWVLIKAMIFNEQQLYARQAQIEQELFNISSEIDATKFFPLVWFHLNETKRQNEEDNHHVTIDFKNSTRLNNEKLCSLIPNVEIDDKKSSIRVGRDSLYSLLNILSCVADFKFKSLMIKDCHIAIGEQVLFPKFNRIYGKNDIPKEIGFDLSSFMPTQFSKLMRGKYPYYCPNGWLRYSLRVAKSSEEFEQKYADWPVAYHGTSSLVLINILKDGFRLVKGIREYTNVLAAYFSPSIEYSGHKRYSKVMKIKNKRNQEFYIQAILQCRLNPESFIVYNETMLSKERRHIQIDPNFDNNELEWIITEEKYYQLKKANKEVLVIYGIMLRITKENPEKLPINKWW